MLAKLQEALGVHQEFEKPSDLIEYINQSGHLDQRNLIKIVKLMANEIDDLTKEQE